MRRNPPISWILNVLFFGGLILGVILVYLLSGLPFWVCVIAGVAGYGIYGALAYCCASLRSRAEKKGSRVDEG